MLGFQGGVSIPLVKGGVKAPPAKRQCRAGPKAGARRGFTPAPTWAVTIKGGEGWATSALTAIQAVARGASCTVALVTAPFWRRMGRSCTANACQWR